MAYSYDIVDRIGTKATLGLIVLHPDETIEHDFRRLLPLDDVSLYVSRIPSGPEVSGDSLAAMKSAIADLVQSGCDAAKVTEPVTSLVAACNALGITRIGFLSPYVAEVSDALRATLQNAGVQSPVFGSFEEAVEARVARIAPQSIVDAALDLAGKGGIDALFLSCTNLRTLDVIQTIEAATGLPVLSSNLVLAWDMARESGISLQGDWGQLSRI